MFAIPPVARTIPFWAFVGGVVATSSGGAWAIRGSELQTLERQAKIQVEMLQAQNAELVRQNQKLSAELLSKQQSPQPAASRSVAGRDTLDVEFISPRNSDSVGQKVDIEFKVKGSVPAGYSSVVLIKDPRGKYWSWGATSGRMNGVTLGLESDTRLDFDIGVLITDQQVKGNEEIELPLPHNILYKKISVSRR